MASKVKVITIYNLPFSNIKAVKENIIRIIGVMINSNM